jgi:aurora kinase
LGSGRFGEVYLGKVKSSGQLVAIKSVLKNKNKLDRKLQVDEVDSLTREIEIHSSLDHPKIVKMFRHFEDDNRIYLILVSILFT